MPPPAERQSTLDPASVHDRASFIAFVEAMAAEREEAAEMERACPVAYAIDGAMGWKNADIASFLWASLDYLFHRPETEPSWRTFANILYCGKIIE
jgi:hypothetical protein